MKVSRLISRLSIVVVLLGLTVASGGASSHREAPLIAEDPYADNTDVYAFASPDKPGTVTLLADFIPLETAYAGPYFYKFADDVMYEINIDNVGDGMPHIQYRFRFQTQYRIPDTALYNVGPIESIDSANLNQIQTYDVSRTEYDRNGQMTSSQVIGGYLKTPPVNIGPKSTPNYEQLAASAVYNTTDGSKVFAGQRDDPFFIDVGSLFDLLTIRKLPGNAGGGKDGLARYNVHTIALQIPIERLTANGAAPKDANDPNAIIGVWATASRQQMRVLPDQARSGGSNDFVQVSRLGQPLVNELIVPTAFKDHFNGSKPQDDAQFLGGVQDPEPARLLKALYNVQVPPAPRDDLVAIFLTGLPGLNQPANVKPSEMLRLNMLTPPTAEPNRLGVLGGDMQGFPNGRRLTDDVVDIELRALAGAAYPLLHPDFKPDPAAGALGDGVDANDRQFLPIFPYVATPHQGYDVSTERVP